jgi:hypothetical protein
VLAAWKAAAATGRRLRLEQRIRIKGGEYRRFRVEALPLRDERGAIERWHGVIVPIDDTARRPAGPRDRTASVDYYPLRDARGNFLVVELTHWEDRPDDPEAVLHPSGTWYRIKAVESAV